MGSLVGFRHPQFSEDVAWLPSWLQPPMTSDGVNQIPSPSIQRLDKISVRECESSSSADGGRYKSCHLFLSGEDNSQVNLSSSSSSAHGLHFHLHLSLNGNSEDMPSTIPDRLLEEGLYAGQPIQQFETCAIAEEILYNCEADKSADKDNLWPSPQKENLDLLDPQSLVDDEGMKPEENARSFPDIDDAVELSISASEALIIHEVLKSGMTIQNLPVSAVLEAALQVKQARLDDYSEIVSNSIDDASEIECFSDLDEYTMVDAYEDVGLSVTGDGDLCFSDSIPSQVRDTYASEIYISGNNQICKEIGGQEVDCGEISAMQHVNDVNKADALLETDEGLEVRNVDRKEQVDDVSLGLETANLDCDINPRLQWSLDVPDSSFSTEVKHIEKKVDITMGGATSFQPTVNSSPRAWISEISGSDDKLKNAVRNKFQSRWLGGWTWKEETNSSAHMDDRNARNILEPAGCETSFLSESADVAPDQNSCVQKQDKASNINSQSSVAVDSLCTKASQGILLSKDDVVICPSLTSVDPLCSAVPCSISSENISFSVGAQNHKDQVDATKSFSPRPEADVANVKRASYQSSEFAHGDGQTVQMVNGDTPETCRELLKRTSSLQTEFVHGVREDVALPSSDGSEPTVRRQVMLLGNYSMLLPSLPAHQVRETRIRKRSFPMKCNLKFLTNVMQTSAMDLANQANSCNKTAKDDAELPIHMQKEKISPLMNSMEVSKCLSRDVGGDEYQEQTVVPKNNVEQSKGSQQANSNCKNPSSALVPRRKRVRFSDADINLKQMTDTHTQRKPNTNCLVTRSSKRLKSSYWQIETRAQEVKTHFITRRVKERKTLMFQNIDFLLTGFSVVKEKKIEGLIRRHGGMVLSEIPSPGSRGNRSTRFKSRSLPVVLCFKKLQTTKFLYGCAVKANILKVDWLADSIAAGSILPPNKYMILPDRASERGTGLGKPVICNDLIFDRVGVMLHGKLSFCTKTAKVVKHGGGMVFKTLHWLVQSLDAGKISVGVIVNEDENGVSRHLKQCASERKIPMMPFGWIINSLYRGRLLPALEKDYSSSTPQLTLLEVPDSEELSQEI